MIAKLAQELGWPQVDLFPLDREMPVILRDRDGTYSMFLPEGLTSFSVPSSTNRELLLASDRRLHALRYPGGIAEGRGKTEISNKIIVR